MQQFRNCIRIQGWDLHLIIAYPDSAVFLNADPGPASQNFAQTLNFVNKKYLIKNLLVMTLIRTNNWVSAPIFNFLFYLNKITKYQF